MGRKKKKKNRTKALIFVLLGLILLALGALGFLVYQNIQDNKTDPYYLASENPQIVLRDKEGNEHSFVRGTSVDIKKHR